MPDEEFEDTVTVFAPLSVATPAIIAHKSANVKKGFDSFMLVGFYDY